MLRLLRILLYIGAIVYLLRALIHYFFPVIRMTAATTRQMKKMQAQMEEMERKMNERPGAAKKVGNEGEYTDYEEVK